MGKYDDNPMTNYFGGTLGSKQPAAVGQQTSMIGGSGNSNDPFSNLGNYTKEYKSTKPGGSQYQNPLEVAPAIAKAPMPMVELGGEVKQAIARAPEQWSFGGTLGPKPIDQTRILTGGPTPYDPNQDQMSSVDPNPYQAKPAIGYLGPAPGFGIDKDPKGIPTATPITQPVLPPFNKVPKGIPTGTPISQPVLPPFNKDPKDGSTGLPVHEKPAQAPQVAQGGPLGQPPQQPGIPGLPATMQPSPGGNPQQPQQGASLPGSGMNPDLTQLQQAVRARAERDMMNQERALRAGAEFNRVGDGDSGAFTSAIANARANAAAGLNNQLAGLDYTAMQQQAQRELEKYGIDTNAQVSRDGFASNERAASMHAAAANAAANAGAAAQMAGYSHEQQMQAADLAYKRYVADQNFELGYAGLDTQREYNYMNFSNNSQQNILGYINSILGASPDKGLGGLPYFGGNIITGLP